MIGQTPKVVDLRVRRGSTWSIQFVYKDQSGQPIDLAGYTARMHIREAINSPALVMELSTENGRLLIDASAGRISILVDSDATATLSPENVARALCYDLELVQSSTSPDTVVGLLAGRVFVSPEVTR